MAKNPLKKRSFVTFLKNPLVLKFLAWLLPTLIGLVASRVKKRRGRR